MWRLAIILFQKSLVMRIKVSYKINGKETLEVGQINNFPRELWGHMVRGYSCCAQIALYIFRTLVFWGIFMIYSFMRSQYGSCNKPGSLFGIKLWSVWWLHTSSISTEYSCMKKSKSFFFFFRFEANICIILNSLGANYFLWRWFDQCVSGYKCSCSLISNTDLRY